jgi:Mg-chelatase subunit ChlD
MSNDKLQRINSDKLELLRKKQELALKKEEELKQRNHRSSTNADRPYQGTVFLMMDCSNSMEWPDTKIIQAKNGAVGFAQQAIEKGYRIGVIRFSTDSDIVLESSNKIGDIKSAVERLEVYGGTNMAAAIGDAVIQLKACLGERVMCIVTDGQPDNVEDAHSAARQAKREKIDIITIGTDDADLAFLEEIATRKDLAMKVERKMLQQAIIDASKLLPGKHQ